MIKDIKVKKPNDIVYNILSRQIDKINIFLKFDKMYTKNTKYGLVDHLVNILSTNPYLCLKELPYHLTISRSKINKYHNISTTH